MKTRLISNFKYWSLPEYPQIRVLKYLRAWDTCRPANSSQSPCLFIIDHMDALTNTTRSLTGKLSEDQKREWVDVFRSYRNRKDLILITSRIVEDWLNLENSQKYALKGLSNTNALALASRIMREIGWESFLKEPSTLEHIECLVNRVDRNPLSINLLLRGSKDTVDRVQRSGQAPLLVFSADRPDNLLPDSPEHILHFLLLAFVTDAYEPEGIRQFQEFLADVRHLCYQRRSREKYALLSLLPLSGIYCEDWYEEAKRFWVQRFDTQLIPSNEEYFRQFVTQNLIIPGWAEHIGNIPSTEPNKWYRCIRIHPVFVNSLRYLVMSDPNLTPLAGAIWLPFITNEAAWACFWTDWRQYAEMRKYAQLRATSLLAAGTMGFNIAVLNNCSIITPYYVHIILNILWYIAMGINTPIFSPGLLYFKMEQLLDFVEKRLCNNIDDPTNLGDQGYVGKNIDIMMRTCDALSTHFVEKSHRNLWLF